MSDKVSKTLTSKIELFGGYIHEVKRGEDNNTSLPFQIFQLKKKKNFARLELWKKEIMDFLIDVLKMLLAILFGTANSPIRGPFVIVGLTGRKK